MKFTSKNRCTWFDNSRDNVTPESYQPGGKEFTVTVSDCALQGTGDVLNQLHIDFRALSGVMAAGSRQIFANEVATGAKNVGVVLFSIQGNAANLLI